MPVRGPSLLPLARKIRTLGSDEGRHSLGETVSRAVLRQVERQFDHGADPYGRPWKPLAHGHRDPLVGSGRLLRSFDIEVTSGGFRLNTPVEFVTAHQEGATIPARRAGGQELQYSPRSGKLLRSSRARKMKLVYVSTARAHLIGQTVIPKRQIVPESSTGGVGLVWGGVINEAARDWMRGRMG